MDLQRNSSAQRPTMQPNRVSQENSATRSTGQGTKNKMPKWKVALLVLGVLLLAGLVGYKLLVPNTHIDTSKYQAVFLENGQVYFGKLTGWGSPRPVLTDVYYFQAAQTGNNSNADNASPAASQPTSQTLVKLGEEIHRPSDKLIINKDAVLFVENIETEGEVVKAINKDKEADK